MKRDSSPLKHRRSLWPCFLEVMISVKHLLYLERLKRTASGRGYDNIEN
jgi:hypothetical protein